MTKLIMPDPVLPRRTLILGGAALAGVSLAAPAFAVQPVADLSGRPVRLTPTTRLLTIGGDVTEIVYALGFGRQVIGVDRNSKWPPDAGKLLNVGARTQLAPEGVIAVRPDLILMSEDSGPPATIEVLKQAGLAVVLVPNRYTTEGVSQKIAVISRILGREREGQAMAAAINARLAAIAKATAAVPAERKKRVLFTHSIARGAVSAAAGLGTPADAIIRAAGGVNAMAAIQGVKPATAEAVVAARPDVILMARNSDGTAPTREEVFAVPALQGTPAFRQKAFVLMAGPFMLGFGPRTADAIHDLAHALYPDLKLPGRA